MLDHFDLDELKEIGKTIAETFHLVTTRGQYLSEAGLITEGQVALMTLLIIETAKLKKENKK